MFHANDFTEKWLSWFSLSLSKTVLLEFALLFSSAKVLTRSCKSSRQVFREKEVMKHDSEIFTLLKMLLRYSHLSFTIAKLLPCALQIQYILIFLHRLLLLLLLPRLFLFSFPFLTDLSETW